MRASRHELGIVQAKEQADGEEWQEAAVEDLGHLDHVLRGHVGRDYHHGHNDHDHHDALVDPPGHLLSGVGGI